VNIPIFVLGSRQILACEISFQLIMNTADSALELVRFSAALPGVVKRK